MFGVAQQSNVSAKKQAERAEAFVPPAEPAELPPEEKRKRKRAQDADKSSEKRKKRDKKATDADTSS
jgi:ribosomal RNA assembly protein